VGPRVGRRTQRARVVGRLSGQWRRPVFDLDSVGLLSLLEPMQQLPLGCVVTNHKRHEREVVPQYPKLRKKVRAVARFVINQVGWHAAKMTSRCAGGSSVK